MYVPTINKMDDKAEVIDFINRFSFATIVSAADNLPIATHLPFLVSEQEGKVILSSHFAKANDQWKTIEQNPVLVIFSEPHAYISPSNYEKKLNVPTWNYIAVHAYGKARLLNDPEQVMSLLESTINTYEKAYNHQWDELPMNYKASMVKGIVAFKIEVTHWHSKAKLSQNKTQTEQKNIVQTLSESPDSQAKIIAEYMKSKPYSKNI